MGEFSEKLTFSYMGTKCHSKVGRKVHVQNKRWHCETVCHSVTNRPNLLGRNVTIWGGRTIRPL
jgi:hypothetical protein